MIEYSDRDKSSWCWWTFGLRQDDSAACLAGLEDISDGRILIGDQVVNDVAPKDRDIAMCSSLTRCTRTCRCMTHGLRAELRKTPQGGHRPTGEERADILESGTCWTASPASFRAGSDSVWR